MANVKKKPLCTIINGVRIPSAFSPKCAIEAMEYKPTPDDVIICTYPKCGTTWMQMVATMILRKGRPLEAFSDFETVSPFIDMLGAEGVTRMPRPGAIKTHLPYHVMPYSPEAKYIFVIRNPLDACVSLYHHTRMHAGFRYWDGEFDDFFELFMAGEVEYDDYFDHLLAWFPHRNDKNVLYTTYEAMKEDLRSVVQNLAQFLGDEYSRAIETDPEILENILRYSSFKYMKSMFREIYETRNHKLGSDLPEGVRYQNKFYKSLNIPKDLPKVDFVRKGSIGEWREYFSVDQYARMKEKFDSKTAGTDIPSLWPDLFK